MRLTKFRWLVVAGSGGAIVLMVAPFVLTAVDPSRAVGLLAASHFQTLVLGLLTVALAIIALNTYIGLEDRIERKMEELSLAIKQDTKHRLRLLMDLERSRTDPAVFEQVIETITAEPELYAYFQEDIKKVFDGNQEPGTITAATAGWILAMCQNHPELCRDPHWKFWVSVTTQTTNGWQEALRNVPFLSQAERDTVIKYLPWLFERWHAEKLGDYQNSLSDLVKKLANHFDMPKQVLPEMKKVIQEHYWANGFPFAGRPGGKVSWYIRRQTGELERWEVGYGNLLDDFNILLDTFSESGESSVGISDALLRDKTIAAITEQRANYPGLMLIVVYPIALIRDQIREEKPLSFGVHPVYASPTVPLDLGNRALSKFLTKLQQDENMEILWAKPVDPQPRRPQLYPHGLPRRR